MASCIRGSEGNRGNVSPRTLIRNPLISSESRRKVYKFFEECNLQSATEQLRLWELCDTLLEHRKHMSSGFFSQLFSSSNYKPTDIQKEANDLYQFIEQQSDLIYLDNGVLQELKNAVDSGHVDNITREVTNTKRATNDLLSPSLNAFTNKVKEIHGFS